MSLELQNQLRGILLKSLENITLEGSEAASKSWGSLERDLLNLCLKNGVITTEKVKAKLSSRISWIGQSSYMAHKRVQAEPERLASPEALAYAMRSGALTKAEADTITFAEGVDSTTFCPEVGENFIDLIIAQLRGQ